MDCFLGKKKQNQYSEAVRKFAITLHFYSPRAYQYLRQKFSNRLPHAGTIRKWYSNSNSNGDPGINNQTVEKLKKLVEELKSVGEEFVCVLSHDEMSVKKKFF